MDSVKKFLAYDKKVQIICVDTKEMVQEMINIHDLTPTTAALAGRVITASGILGHTEMKEDDDLITIQLKGNGPVRLLICPIVRNGKTIKAKIYVQDPSVELPLNEVGKIDVSGAIGKQGYLNIIKKNRTTNKEYSGLVPLVSGEIAEDFTEYFVKSSQKPTVLALGVLLNKEGVLSSGGYMISLLPDTDEEVINKIEEAVQKAPSVSDMLNQGKTLEEIARIVSGDENVSLIEDGLKIIYECDCNKASIEKVLISLGKEELTKIIEEDGKAEILCHFCNKKYDFNKEDLISLRDQI